MDGTIGDFPAIYMETGIQNVWLSIWDYPGGGALGFEHGGLGAQRKGEVREVFASEGPVPIAVTLGGCIAVMMRPIDYRYPLVN